MLRPYSTLSLIITCEFFGPQVIGYLLITLKSYKSTNLGQREYIFLEGIHTFVHFELKVLRFQRNCQTSAIFEYLLSRFDIPIAFTYFLVDNATLSSSKTKRTTLDSLTYLSLS